MWKNRAEHAEHRLRELEREGATVSTGSKSDSSSVRVEELEREGACVSQPIFTNYLTITIVTSLSEKLTQTHQALSEEQARRTELEDQLQSRSGDKAVHEDELAIRRMYEDITGFIINEVDMYNPQEEQRRYRIGFSGADYHGTWPQVY